MPRRMITPNIWRNESFGDLPLGGKLLFIGIFSSADDDGRLNATPRFLRTEIFRYDTVTEDDVKDWRDQCHAAGLIQVYTIKGHEYVFLPTWHQNQMIRKDRYTASKIPPPPGWQPPPNHPATAAQPSGNHPAGTAGHSIVQSSIVKSSGSTVNELPLLEDVVRAYEDNIGMLTPSSADRLRDIAEEYPEGWFEKAVDEAVRYNKRNLAYIERILERWKVEGPDTRSRDNGQHPDGRKQAPGRVFDWSKADD